MKNSLDRLTAVLIILFLFLSMGRMYIRPKIINNYENRNAVQAPAFTASSYLRGDFQSDFDSALSDQILFSQTGKKVYNKCSSSLLLKITTPLLNKEKDSYVRMKNMLSYGGYLVYEPWRFSDRAENLKARIDNINTCMAAHPELEFYTYFIQCDSDINFETGARDGVMEYVRDGLSMPADRFAFFAVDNFDTYKELFYKTDHHWNAQGSYLGYCQVAKLLGLPEENLMTPNGDLTDTGRQLSGSKAAAAGASSVITEPFKVLRYDYPAMYITINGQAAGDYGMGGSLLSRTDVAVSYGGYYGGDDGEVVFDTHQSEKENVLIIGESFDNAVLKLLACGFNKTYSVDLRNFEVQTGQPFHFGQYIAQHDITKVLFIGSNAFFTSADFMVEG